jgi:hypothetical protein
MSAPKLQDRSNGHDLASGNGVTRKRLPGQRNPAGEPVAEPASHSQDLAPFAAIETEAIDAQMCLTHPVVWLEPEVEPVIPESSGLSIERRHRVPAPDFVRLRTASTCDPPLLEKRSDLLSPRPQPRIPASGLALLGWDPRVVAACVEGKGGHE